MLKERIDLHGHYFPPAYNDLLEKYGVNYPDGVKKPYWSITQQLEYMHHMNISFAVLSISSPAPSFGSSAELIETIRRSNIYGTNLQNNHPDKLAVLASLPLPDIDAAVNEIRYCRTTLNMNGFALLSNYNGVYLGSKVLEPVMEELNKQPTLLTIHPTTPAVTISDVNEELPVPVMEYFFETTRAVTNMLLKNIIHRYPNLRFVIPHGGAFLTLLADRMIPLTKLLLHNQSLDIAGSLSKMYYDLAGFSMPKQFGLLSSITDTSHLLYGSDSPFTSLPFCQKLAKDMDDSLTNQETDLIYKKNPAALLSETGLI